MINYSSKLPPLGTSIFAVMSKLAKDHDAINLGQGFPDFEISLKLKNLVSKYVQEGKNQYAPMPGLHQLRETLSKKYNTAYGSNINPGKEITIHSGATQAIFTTIMAFVNQNDEVIIIEPAYDCYLPTIALAKAKPISIPVTAPHYKIDWDQVQDKITNNTKMIIINNPHNPIGKILASEDLLALQEIVKDKNILILSDEVYEHLIYDGKQHQSVLAYPQLAEQSVAVYSFGKTFHATGWKMGYSIAPEHLMKEIRNIHQWNVFSVNSFLQYALDDFLQDPEEYHQLPQFYQRKRDLFQEALSQCKLRPIHSAGTYFQLYDYSEISDLTDINFSKWLVSEHGVATIPISPFYSNGNTDKVVRFCFAKDDRTLMLAANKLSAI